MKFDNDDEKDEWLKTFDNACKKAGPPESQDKLLSKAFFYAYRAVRWHYGKSLIL
jgi:truncated hemoglobin YjbI